MSEEIREKLELRIKNLELVGQAYSLQRNIKNQKFKRKIEGGPFN